MASELTREQLLAALEMVAGNVTDACFLDDDGISGRYFDWSGHDGRGTKIMEVGNGETEVMFAVSRADLVKLHAALTKYLLSGPE